MAKKSSTVHLEESTWEEISEYQEKFGCSRNDAIERMFTERRLMLSFNNKEDSKKLVNPNKEVTVTRAIKQEIDLALDSAYEDMPD